MWTPEDMPVIWAILSVSAVLGLLFGYVHYSLIATLEKAARMAK